MANKVWRPADYSTPEELEVKVDEYFAWGFRMKKYTTQTGLEVSVPSLTMTDLAIFLWFESRQSLYDYGIKPEFAYIIKRATLFIEREYEERLWGQSPTWAIFALKNMGWKDKQEIDQNTKHSWSLNIIKPTLE